MRHISLLIAGFALIVSGLMVSVVLNLGGPWVGIGLALEIIGVLVLGVNIVLMLKNRAPGGPPR